MSDARNSDEQQTLATYLSDMLALERHIKAPMKTQLAAAEHGEGKAANVIRKIESTINTHISALEAQLEAAGGSPASGLKTAWASIIGAGAAIVDSARPTKVSKILRDDYTALSLAAVSYEMLHATAAGLGDAAVKALAKRHLDDVTPLIVEISSVIPQIVLDELAADGTPVSVTAAQLTQQVSKEAWSGKSVGSN